MENDSWIKLFRRFKEWEWYDDINTKTLYIHLLLSVNYEEKNWRGKKIKRGQLITSIGNLANDCGLTIQQTRNSLKKLKSTGEITIKTTNKNTLVTISKYSIYQDSDLKKNKQSNKQTTNKQQADSKPTSKTTNKKNLETIEKYNTRENEEIKKNKQNNKQITIKEQTKNNQRTTTKEYKNIRNIERKKEKENLQNRDTYNQLIEKYTENAELQLLLKKHLQIRFAKSNGNVVTNESIIEGFNQLNLLTKSITSEDEKNQTKIEIDRKSTRLNSSHTS